MVCSGLLNCSDRPPYCADIIHHPQPNFNKFFVVNKTNNFLLLGRRCGANLLLKSAGPRVVLEATKKASVAGQAVLDLDSSI